MTNLKGLKRYLFSTSWLFIEQCLRFLAGLLVGIWVARYLGPSDFGILNYIMAFIALFATISKLGLDDIILRDISNNATDKHDELLGTFFWMKVAASCLVIFLLFAFLIYTNTLNISNHYIVVIFISVFFQSFEVIFIYFQAQVLGKMAAISKLSQLFISSLLKIFLILYEADLFWFISLLAFDFVSLAIIYVYSFKLHKNLTFFTKFNLDSSKNLLIESIPLLCSSVFVIMYMRIDQIMIFNMVDENELGIYSAASRLSEALSFIPIIMTASFMPAILNAKKISNDLYIERLTILYSFLAWSALIIILGIILFSSEIVNILFGAAYSNAHEILVILSFNSLGIFVGLLSIKQLVAEKLGNIILIKSIISVVLNILLNLKLIPVYGGYGAAIASFISQFAAVFLYDFLDPRMHNQLKMKIKAIFMPWILLKYLKSILYKKN